MTVTTLASSPRFLMCPPQHFAVTYSINPWMDPAAWAGHGASLHATAEAQWTALHLALRESGAAIETVIPHEGLPDLVFTANAAVVLDGKALRRVVKTGAVSGGSVRIEQGLIGGEDLIVNPPAGLKNGDKVRQKV